MPTFGPTVKGRKRNLCWDKGDEEADSQPPRAPTTSLFPGVPVTLSLEPFSPSPRAAGSETCRGKKTHFCFSWGHWTGLGQGDS